MVALLVASLVLLGPESAPIGPASPGAKPALHPRQVADLPLDFVHNRGQSPKRAKFVAQKEAVAAAFGGVTQTATLTVTAPASTSDTVSIQLAEYSGGRLKVEATSSSSTATLKVYVSSTDGLIGTLQNEGGGRYRSEFSWPSSPGSITVKSSLGGSATKTVTVK